MRLLLFLLGIGLFLHDATALEKYELMTIPFKIENGTQTTEQIFLEYQTHSVLYDKDVAMNMTIISSEYISFAVDQCGVRLFESTVDIKNATYIWEKSFFSALQVGIRKTCTVYTQYALDFTIDCKGPCNGKIYFMIFPHKGWDYSNEVSNPMQGVIPFKTNGGGPQAKETLSIEVIIEGSFMNPSAHVQMTTEYSTSYTLAVEKCGLEFLKVYRDGSRQMHVLSWKEIRQFRLMTTLKCPEAMDDTFNYLMSSEKDGNGTVAFHLAMNQKDLLENHPLHPLENNTSMELARGVPKHKAPVVLATASGTIVTALFSITVSFFHIIN